MKWSLISVAWFIMSSASAAEIGRYQVPDSDLELQLATVPGDDYAEALALNRITALDVRIVQATATTGNRNGKPPLSISDFKFEARMPAHRHGMIVKPRVSEISPGVFRVLGVKLHMAGTWRLIFDFKAGGVARQVIVIHSV